MNGSKKSNINKAMTKRKNILILASTYPRWSGDNTPGFVADFAKHIAAELDNVYVLVPHFYQAKKRESSGNVHVKRVRYFTSRGETIFYGGGGITKIKKTPLYAIKLLGYLTSLFFNTLFAALRYDVRLINAHWIIPQGFVAVLVKLLIGKPVALTVHGADILSLNGRYMRMVKRFVLKHADFVYVNSSVTQKACEAIYKREYLLVPMGINLEKFQLAKPSKPIKNKLKLTNFTIIFVGRLMETKGVIYLLESMRQLKESGRTAKAVIVGAGPLEDELQAFVKKHSLQEQVIFTGWVDQSELPGYYGSADVFAGPSLYEAQGLVFAEALAAGLPVITTKGNGPDDFIQDGVNGYLIKSKSQQELFEKLAKLYDNPTLLRQMKAAAPQSVREKFAWETAAKSYIKSWRRYL